MAAQNLVKHTYTATAPDGATFTRTTTRAYEFVVFTLCHRGHYEGRTWVVEDAAYWSDAHWVGSLALAQKAAQKYADVKIIPVTNLR